MRARLQWTRYLGFVIALTVVQGLAMAQLNVSRYEAVSDVWFQSPDGERVIANILSHQSPHGDWPKGVNTDSRTYRGDRTRIEGTWDNQATFGEMRFLARAYRITARPDCLDAFLLALDHILVSQYPTGGWPQYSPPSAGYPRHITFNDNVMVNILTILREVTHSTGYDFVEPERKKRAQQAFDRGVGCILQCQVRVDGKLTVWGAQHDEITLQPRAGRPFEPVSLSAGESAGLACFLMTLENPSPGVILAVEAAREWFEQAALRDIRIEAIHGDRTVVVDPAAPLIWARFYEIGTMRPLFGDRRGNIRYALSEIPFERRNLYSWYGPWGDTVAAEYARWKQPQVLHLEMRQNARECKTRNPILQNEATGIWAIYDRNVAECHARAQFCKTNPFAPPLIWASRYLTIRKDFARVIE